jgi:hypothetical protein
MQVIVKSFFLLLSILFVFFVVVHANILRLALLNIAYFCDPNVGIAGLTKKKKTNAKFAIQKYKQKLSKLQVQALKNKIVA